MTDEQFNIMKAISLIKNKGLDCGIEYDCSICSIMNITCFDESNKQFSNFNCTQKAKRYVLKYLFKNN